MEYETETERVVVNAETAMVQSAPNGTPNLAALTKALLVNLMDHILRAMEADAGLPHRIEVSHTWKNGDGTGEIQGGRLTLTLDALDADEYAEAQAQVEQAQAQAAGSQPN